MESLEAHRQRVQRMEAEAATLQVRIKAASDFIEGPQFRTINELEQNLLVSQVMAMQVYFSILTTRINLARD